VTVLVVGAGLSGATVAERLTARGRRVLVIDRRPHVAGNAFDEPMEWGFRHHYGPHIFHTNSARVLEYLSRFTGWRPYEHRVVAAVGARFVPLPIGPLSLEALVEAPVLDPAGWFAEHATQEEPRNAAMAARRRMGDFVYETLLAGYTEKMWGIAPERLDAAVTERIQTRLTRDDRYFDDRFQVMPRDGYAVMVSRMLEGAEVRLGVEWLDLRTESWEHVVFTGPLDEYFDGALGRLPYRSLRFEFLATDRSWIPAPAATLNQPSRLVAWTRETDQRRVSGGGPGPTEIVREFPTGDGQPMYPMPTAEAARLRASYLAHARRFRGVTFAGRLGTYRYWNMDQVVANGLTVAGSVP
jgi:UDP-galactopyranose mutase